MLKSTKKQSLFFFLLFPDHRLLPTLSHRLRWYIIALPRAKRAPHRRLDEIVDHPQQILSSFALAKCEHSTTENLSEVAGERNACREVWKETNRDKRKNQRLLDRFKFEAQTSRANYIAF